MSHNSIEVISPGDGSVFCRREYAGEAQIRTALSRADSAFHDWKALDISRRAELCTALVDDFVSRKDEIGPEITRQMGRPIRYAAGEVAGFEERARHMIAIAAEALETVRPEPKDGFHRFIERVPLGTVFVVAPWNYPYLTSVNAIIPALMAGNTVVLKHSSQTPLCAEQIHRSARAAGFPEGVFQFLHLNHDGTSQVAADPSVRMVCFTGSVDGGIAMEKAVAGQFKNIGLELGGKDPAYVRADADLGHAVETAIDGAFFNSGQSCCGIERIYVHRSLYDAFVDKASELVRAYRLGDPMDPETTLGPMVRTSAAEQVRKQVQEAVSAGSTALIDPALFPADKPGTPWLAPQILTGVNRGMRIMREETFGPVVTISPVADDAEAITAMNDSDFGLTAAIFTGNADEGIRIGKQIETGTVFINRCDYLDPALAWTGVKNSGRGCTLSSIGYEHLTRPKSFHVRLPV